MSSACENHWLFRHYSQASAGSKVGKLHHVCHNANDPTNLFASEIIDRYYAALMHLLHDDCPESHFVVPRVFYYNYLN